MSDIIKIFDTTLRDGEQSPGASMNIVDKIRIAEQLAKLRVDIIEAGFPNASDGDFEAVRDIAETIKGVEIAGLARANDADIDRCWEAIQNAENPRIHTFIATSDIHMEHKLHMSRDQVLEAAVAAVKRAAGYTPNVEFSCEDATRSDPEFICQICELAIANGAKVVNIPDTVGYTTPAEYAWLMDKVFSTVKNIGEATVSIHCHDDLGLAVANSLAAVRRGARQVECTVNGIGERAGNAALEEIAMVIAVRPDQFNGATTNIDTRQIYHTSRLLATITGLAVPPNKAIVGGNAFAHEAGIHQHGVLNAPITYEIMTPESVGLARNKLVLGKHSGRHAFRDRLSQLGFSISDDQLNAAFKRFKEVADKKKNVYDEDIEAIIADEVLRRGARFVLKSVNFASGTEMLPTATVVMNIDDVEKKHRGIGGGPVDAIFNTIREMTGIGFVLEKYAVNAITGGTDALGEVTCIIEYENVRAMGAGADNDVMVSSAKALVNALNRLENLKQFKRSGDHVTL